MDAHQATSARTSFLIFYRDILVYWVLFQFFVPALNGLLAGGLSFQAGSTSFSNLVLQAASNFILQVISLFVLVNSILIARLFNISFRLIFFALLPAALMICWILLSIAWSQYPDLTLRRGGRAVVELLFIVLLALSLRENQTMLRTLFRAFFVMNLLDLVSFAVVSVASTPIEFEGIHGQKNLAGVFFFLALPIFIVGIFDRTVARSSLTAIFASVTAVPMFVFSLSKTSMGAFIICAILVFLARFILAPNINVRAVPAFVFILLVGALSFLVYGFVYGFAIADFLNLLFDDSTLTGRDQVWRIALDKFNAANPLLGVGYGALWWTGLNTEEFGRISLFGWAVGEAHNGYIDILAQLGYVGVSFLILFVLIIFRRIIIYFRGFKRDRFLGLRDYALYVIWGSLIFNLTESSFFQNGQPLWFMLLFISTTVTSNLYRNQDSFWLARRALLARPRIISH